MEQAAPRAELGPLSGASLLLDEGVMRVYALPASETEPLMRRFGCPQPGGGRHYTQLVAWDCEREEITGGCRLGAVSELVSRHGYTSLAFSSAFNIDPQLLSRLHQAIDLGKIFVSPAHPYRAEVVALLWRGIGAIIDQRPHVRLLTSTIRVSSPYSEPSQRLIAGFLLSGHRRSPWAHQASAAVPFAPAGAPPDMKRLDAAILATDGQKAPCCVHHHLEIGMRGLACGAAPEERGGVDILCLADLRCAPIALLQRLLGSGHAQRFVIRHAGSRLLERAA